jgi:hypothetical protein
MDEKEGTAWLRQEEDFPSVLNKYTTNPTTYTNQQ